ncbi:hypothetical protein B0H67DRAFT_124712 [Lasiosphaeris hirsuta]|uniref:Uncharacterized protein n=1 Tax=Lasiosphaeris hirsuta TaxID=260670 RepID=A0AA40B0B3_9PEZI|nr:hypothetical protein B0H67DRAFT_124712 [Lasiosphaeris hirsuta]
MRMPIIAQASGAAPPALPKRGDAEPEAADTTLQAIIGALQAAQAQHHGVWPNEANVLSAALSDTDAPAAVIAEGFLVETGRKSLVFADPATRPSIATMPGMKLSETIIVWLIFGFMVFSLVGLCIADWRAKSHAQRRRYDEEQTFAEVIREIMGKCCGKRKKKAAPKKPTTILPTQSNPLFTPLPIASSGQGSNTTTSGSKDPEKGVIVTAMTAAVPAGTTPTTTTSSDFATTSSPSSSATAAATPSTAGNYRPNSLILPSNAPRLPSPSHASGKGVTHAADSFSGFGTTASSTAPATTPAATTTTTSPSSPGGGSSGTSRASWSQTLVDEGSPVVAAPGGGGGGGSGGGGVGSSTGVTGVGIGIGLGGPGGAGTTSTSSTAPTGSPFFMGAASTSRGRGGGSGDENGSTSKAASSGR